MFPKNHCLNRSFSHLRPEALSAEPSGKLLHEGMKSLFFIILLVALFGPIGQLHAKDALKIAKAEADEHGVFVKSIVQAAYRQARIPMKIVTLPPKRATKYVEEGVFDGSLIREFQFGEANPHLIRVTPPISELKTVAYIKCGSDVSIKDKRDLASLTVAMVGGLAEAKALAQHTRSFQVFKTLEQALQILDAERVDVVIHSSLTEGLLLVQGQFPSLKQIEEPIDRKLVYHYLHERHQETADQISSILTDMRETGAFDALRQRFFAEIP